MLFLHVFGILTLGVLITYIDLTIRLYGDYNDKLSIKPVTPMQNEFHTSSPTTAQKDFWYTPTVHCPLPYHVQE